ncbi:MAG: EF-P lysine aminoacylase EpmA [Gammaproteobacteria bacterium]|nr:EF-P lysine aminoacylase EpmA [Gammaproteobacteria bacterium]
MNSPPHWQPAATFEALRLRAQLVTAIRDFFAARGVLEIDTPVLAHAASTAPQLHSLVTRYTGPLAPQGTPLYLHTSPEFAMKRLLAAGSGAIYQISKAFRDGEYGRWHNPEFTLLEWYRPDYDHHALMDEVAALIAYLPMLQLTDSERTPYGSLFQHHAGIDPHTASVAELQACALGHGVAMAGHSPHERDSWLDLLLTHSVIPQLRPDCLHFIYDYPASQAALARVRPAGPGQAHALAERFELYINGIELANGFHELGDSVEQRRRFEHENNQRTSCGLPPVPIDEHLLSALAHGLPACAGVALGIDRLLMLAGGYSHINEVIAFPFERA